MKIRGCVKGEEKEQKRKGEKVKDQNYIHRNF
jgi:hypothetical protein